MTEPAALASVNQHLVFFSQLVSFFSFFFFWSRVHWGVRVIFLLAREVNNETQSAVHFAEGTHNAHLAEVPECGFSFR